MHLGSTVFIKPLHCLLKDNCALDQDEYIHDLDPQHIHVIDEINRASFKVTISQWRMPFAYLDKNRRK